MFFLFYVHLPVILSVVYHCSSIKLKVYACTSFPHGFQFNHHSLHTTINGWTIKKVNNSKTEKLDYIFQYYESKRMIVLYGKWKIFLFKRHEVNEEKKLISLFGIQPVRKFMINRKDLRYFIIGKQPVIFLCVSTFFFLFLFV